MGESRRKLALVSMIMSLVTVFSKLMGFAKEQIVAKSFGVSAVTDAFLSAQFLPSLLDSLVSVSLGLVLVPLFTEAVGRTREEANKLLYTVLCAAGAFYFIYSAFLWAAASYLLRAVVPGLTSGAMATAISLVRIFGGSTVLSGVIAVMTAFLNVHRRFMVTALAATIANVAVIVAFITYGDKLTVHHMAWAIVLGSLVQAVLLASQLRVLRVSFPGGLDWTGLRRVVALAAPLVFSTMVWMITPLLDKFFASRMEEGSIAALNYALKLIQLPVGVITAGVSTVMFTRFSELASEERYSDLGYEVARTFQGLLFCILPITVFTIMMANPIVSLAFERGKFDYQAVRATADALVFYAIGLAPMALLPVLTMTLFSVKKTRLHVVSNSMAVLTYIVGALALGSLMNHKGLALAYSLGQAAACIVLGLILTRFFGGRPFLIVILSLPKTIVATGLAAVGVWFAGRMDVHGVAYILTSLSVGVVIYLVTHFAVKSKEASWITSVSRLVWTRL